MVAEPVFTLKVPVDANVLAVLRRDVVAAVEAGHARVAIDLDEVGILDSRVIAALISILREVRTVGAEVTLRAGRRPILDTLRVTALDRVFTIEVAPADAAAAPAEKRLASGIAVGSGRRSSK